MNGRSASRRIPSVIGWTRLRQFPVASLVRTGTPAVLRLGGAALQFLATVIIARALGAQAAGDFFFWSAILMTVGQVSTFGLDRLALRELPRLEEKLEARSRFLGTVRSSSVLLAAAFSLPVLFYAVFLYNNGHRPVWWYALPPLCTVSVALCMINGEGMIGSRRPVLGVIYRHTLTTGLFILGVLAALPVLSAQIALVCFTFGFFAAGTMALAGPGYRNAGPPFLLPTRDEFAGYLRLGAPIWLGTLFAAVSYLVPLAILEQTRSSAEVAYLTTAFRIFFLFEILALAVHSLSMPDLSRAEEKGERAKRWRVYRSTVLKGILLIAPPMIVVAIFAGPVMSLFGESFGAEAPVNLRIFMVFGLLLLVVGPAAHLLLMAGRTKQMAAFSFVKMALSCLLGFALIPSLGPAGMAFAVGSALLLEKALCLLSAAMKTAPESCGK